MKVFTNIDHEIFLKKYTNMYVTNLLKLSSMNMNNRVIEYNQVCFINHK